MSVDNKVPEIRFKGFSGNWETYPLATFINSLDAGVSVNSGDRSANENEFGILKTSCVTNGIFEPDENKVVFKKEEINRLKEPVLENTIIISRMNTPALVGANAYISKGYANYFLPDRLWAAKPTSTGNLKFIAYILGSDKGRLALSDLATGTSGSMKNISKPAVLLLELHAPEEKEQTQIGNYFQKLDVLINQHQQKHDKLSSIKKAMLEKMFPKPGETIPKIRFKGFSGEWEGVTLGDYTTFRRGSFPQPYGNKEWYDGEGSMPFVQVVDVSKGLSLVEDTKQKISIKAQPRSVFVPKGSVVVTLQGTIGRVAITQFDSFVDRTILIFERFSRKTDSSFWAYTIQNKFDLEKKRAPGGTIKTITKDALSSFDVLIPSTEEQTAIGNYFKKLDTLINQHQQQITKLNNIKQACLSKMFV